MEKVLIIIPTYNEADNIVRLINEIISLKFGNYIIDILVIDDNFDVGQLFERYTFNTRFKIYYLSNADYVFNVVEECQPKAILLDVMMPSKDGWEILGRLRQHPLTSRLPIVICTVLHEEELALALGASAFLTKPVSRASLLKVLNQVLGEEPSDIHPGTMHN